MKRGWNEVARLGRKGSKYPSVLADRRGWCLRLGPNSESDDRYYSNLPSLAEGLIEHYMRRRLAEKGAGSSLKQLVKDIRAELVQARGLARQVSQIQAAARISVGSLGIDVEDPVQNSRRQGSLRAAQGAGGH